MLINTLDASRPLHPQLWQSKILHTLTNGAWALWILMDFWLISFLTSFQTGSTKCRGRMLFWLNHHNEIPSYLVPEEEKKSLSWKNSGINHTDKACSHPLIRRKSEQNNGMTMGFPWWESRNSTYYLCDYWQVTKPCCSSISLFVNGLILSFSQVMIAEAFAVRLKWGDICKGPGS